MEMKPDKNRKGGDGGFDPASGKPVTENNQPGNFLNPELLKPVTIPPFSDLTLLKNNKFSKLERDACTLANMILAAYRDEGNIGYCYIGETESGVSASGHRASAVEEGPAADACEAGFDASDGSPGIGLTTLDPSGSAYVPASGVDPGAGPNPLSGIEQELELHVVVRTCESDPELVGRVQQLMAENITQYDLRTAETAAQPRPGFSDLRATQGVPVDLLARGTYLLTLQCGSDILGFLIMHIAEGNVPEQGEKIIGALRDRRTELGAPQPDEKFAHGDKVACEQRAKEIAGRLPALLNVDPETRNAIAARLPMELLTRKGVEVCRERGVDTMIGTIRTYPHPNSISFSAHDRHGWRTTAAVVENPINDENGTHATLIGVLLDIEHTAALHAAESDPIQAVIARNRRNGNEG